jgi:hypothetical protein
MDDFIGILKLRLENAIAGHKISLQIAPGDANLENMLQLLEDCHSIISRVEIVNK